MGAKLTPLVLDLLGLPLSQHTSQIYHVTFPFGDISTKTMDAKKFKYNKDKYVKLGSPAHQKCSGMPAAY